ncbi:alpha/beta hydrolase [Streptomyces sp. NPDC046939]|uniref:alpha/beta hydrolase n=1 Tax=Streptomyces sp. NPDC046939 TaxID=3155376 RepID=UPI0033CA581F
MTHHSVKLVGTGESSGGLRAVSLVVALALAGGIAAPVAHGHAREPRGSLVSVHRVAALDRDGVARWLRGQDMEAGAGRYGVRAYRLTYRTLDPHGRPTTATGLLTLPDGPRHRLRLVSDTHGTMVDRAYAPSVGDDIGRVPSYLHASAGAAVAAPDYLGLGRGPGTHPYMDTASSVTASLDMLRAARHAVGRLGRSLSGDVYATGFSQGGQVAMALGATLQTGGDRHFRLRALAPVSGPYDLSGVEVPALFDGRVNDTSGLLYASYLLAAQNRLHPLWKDPRDVFRAPYDRRVEALYDSEHTEEDVFKALPGSVRELLTPSYAAQMRRPTGALKRMLAANDGACAWKPDVPVRLYASAGDTDVPIGNARSCVARLRENGVERSVPVLDQGAVDHFGGFRKAAPQVVRWFASLASASASAG